MTRSILIALFAVALSAPALADVTVKGTGTGKGMGASATITTVTYIKGNKMRTDTVTGDTTRTMIFDVDGQKLYSFDSKKKEADVWDMQAFGAGITDSVDLSAMKASIKPNGKTKEIAGKSAAGYDTSIELPTTLGGRSGMKMTLMLEGPVWIVKGAPGTADYVAFYKAALAKGWIFGDPRGAKGNPGHAKAMAEMQRQFIAIGGIPYETEQNMKMGGDGPMAGMMAKMGMSATNTVDSVDTGALAADLFAPPAGYKLKEQK